MLIVATAAADDVQCAVLVMSCVVPSENVPVAANCCVVPSGMDGIAGVTAIVDRTAAVTVKVVDPVVAPQVAEIVVLPVASPVARPSAAGVSPTVATLVEEEPHCTVTVRSSVLPSVNVPVALNCRFVPKAIEELAGVMVIERSTGSTFRTVDPATEPDLAVIVALPAATAVAKPVELMVAIARLEEVHVAELVRY